MNGIIKYLFLSLLCFVMTGCETTQHITQQTKQTVDGVQVVNISKRQYSPTNPECVFFIKGKKLNTSYQKIAVISVDHYNLVGIKRQQAIIDDLLKNNAASLGGNAIIDVHENDGKIVGHVIRFTD